MKLFPSLLVAALSCFATIAFASAAQADELIANGGFEANTGAGSNSFTSWLVGDQTGGSGSWYVQTGTGSPTSNFTVASPSGGSFAAMTDQGGPRAHVLYQNFVVPSSVSSATLSFEAYLYNHGGAYTNGASLDYNVTNQQSRIDIMTSTADPFSIANGDVLLNVFQTNPGDPLQSGYNTVSTDVTSFLQGHLGETLRLRIGEADNQGNYNFGVDNVSLSTGPTAATPEPGTWAMIGGMSLTGLGACNGAGGHANNLLT